MESQWRVFCPHIRFFVSGFFLFFYTENPVEAGNLFPRTSKIAVKPTTYSTPPVHLYSLQELPGYEASESFAEHLKNQNQSERAHVLCRNSTHPGAICIATPFDQSQSDPAWEAAELAVQKEAQQRSKLGWSHLFPHGESVIVYRSEAASLLREVSPSAICAKDRRYTWGLVDEVKGNMVGVKVVGSVVAATEIDTNDAAKGHKDTDEPTHLKGLVVLPLLPLQNPPAPPRPIVKGRIVAVVCISQGEAPVIFLRNRAVVQTLPRGEWLVPVQVFDPRVIWTNPEGLAEVRASVVVNAAWIPKLREEIQKKQGKEEKKEGDEDIAGILDLWTSQSPIDQLVVSAEAAKTDFTLPLTHVIDTPPGWDPSTAYGVSAVIAGTQNISRGEHVLPAILVDTALRKGLCLLASNSTGVTLRCPELDQLNGIRDATQEAIRLSRTPTAKQASRFKHGKIGLLLAVVCFVMSSAFPMLGLPGSLLLFFAIYKLVAGGLSTVKRGHALSKLKKEVEKHLASGARQAAEEISHRSPQKSHINIYIVTAGRKVEAQNDTQAGVPNKEAAAPLTSAGPAEP